MISKKKLEEFKKIYKKLFSKTLFSQDALEKGTKLLRMVEIVYKPITQKEYDAVQERRKETGDAYKK